MFKQKLTQAMTSVFSAVTLMSCNAILVEGSGHMSEQTYDLDAVSTVSIQPTTEFILKEGTTTNLIIFAQKEIHDHLNIKQIDGHLTIEPKDGYRLKLEEPLRIVLTANNIEKLGFANNAKIEISDYTTSTLSISSSDDMELDAVVTSDGIDINCNGSVVARMSGKTSTLTLNLTGKADVSAFTLNAAHVSVNSTGSGVIQLTALDDLSVSLTGATIVQYRGMPEVTPSIVGSGSVKRVN